jgi:uncharacterized RDD family membrane protein YckC
VAPNGQPLASFGDRFLAYLIDFAILAGVEAVILVPTMIILLVTMSNSETFNADGTTNTLPSGFFLVFFAVEGAVGLLCLAATYIYSVEMMYRHGQTVGKRALKIRVVCVDPARPLTRGAAAKRWLIQFVAGAIVPFVNLLDGLWQLWDQPLRQCLHDKVAQTVVVKLPG